MTLISGQKLYAVVDLANAVVSGWTNFGFGYDDATGSEPEPDNQMPGYELVRITEDELSGATVEEFLALRKPVVTGATPVFDSWAMRAAAPTLTLLDDVSPKDDGSVIATINITGGVASSHFRVVFPDSHIKIDLTDNAGTLDGSGAGSFRVKANGGSSATFIVQPDGNQDFVEASISVTISMSSF